jgi:hypothetical protein
MMSTRRLPVRSVIFGMVNCIFFVGSALAAGPSEYLIYSFPTQVEYAAASGSLITDSAGNLYGTTYDGGAIGYGAVFELLRPVSPSTNWTIATLYSFTAFCGRTESTGRGDL